MQKANHNGRPSLSITQKTSLSCTSLKKPANQSFKLDSSSTVSSKPTTKIDEIYNSCEVLQKDLNIISARFSKETSESPLDPGFLKDRSVQKIRNEDYLKGIRRIKDRIKKRKEKIIPENIKNLVKVVNRRLMRQKTIVQHEDLLSENAVKFLHEHKRMFGTFDRSKSEVNGKVDKRSKNKDIIINPDETVFEGFLDEAAVFKSKSGIRNSSVSLQTSRKFPKSASLKLPKIQEKSKNPIQGDSNNLQNRLTFRKNNKLFNFT